MSVRTITRVRDRCCLCSSDKLRTSHCRKNVPVYMGATNQDIALDVFEQQIWLSCEDCGTVQLRDLLKLDLLYQENHHREVVGETWLSHHREFSDFIVESNVSSILEYGAGAGYLARLVLDQTPVPYTVVEPDPGEFPDEVRVYRGYAEEHLEVSGGVDAVVHSHFLEHLYDPKRFLSEMSDRLSVGKKMIFSIPNFEGLFSHGSAANALNFEHTYYLDRNHLRQLMAGFGFEILREKDFRQHSIFFEASRAANLASTNPTLSYLENVDHKLIASWQSIESFCSYFLDKTKSFVGPRYLFGAHVFSQAILDFLPGVDFQGVLDNDKTKQGSRLYGSALQILDPSVVANLSTEVVVGVLASHYQSEITEQLEAYGHHVTVIGPQ